LRVRDTRPNGKELEWLGAVKASIPMPTLPRTGSLALLSLCLHAACSETAPDPERAGPLAETQLAVSTGHYGWVLIPNPYDPETSYNGSGGDVRIDGFEPGRYSVRFRGLGVAGGNVQVTAYGDDDARCKLGGTTLTSEGDLDVYVLCHAADGSPVRSRFAVGFAEGADFGAHLVADQPTRALYAADPVRSYNATGRVNHVVRAGKGRYTAMLSGLAAASSERGHVLVTAYGDGPAHCKVAGWGRFGSALSVRVVCFDTAGAPTDAGFSLSYSDGTVPAPAGVGAYALADQPRAEWYTPRARTEHSASYELPGASPEAYAPRAGSDEDGTSYLTFPGQRRDADGAPSSAFVTAYGEGASYCKLAGVTGDEEGVTLRTRCFDGTGRPVESAYVGRFVSAGTQ
jgi:hypothetical protein